VIDAWLTLLDDACKTIVATVAVAEAFQHLRRERGPKAPAPPDPVTDDPGPSEPTA
jgi:hypothetical protein